MLKTKTYLTKLILLFAICNSCLFSFADESTNFIHLTAEVDRQQSNVTGVVEDSLGYLWLNSDRGILRFDGYDYKAYPYSEVMGNNASVSSILNIIQDKSKKIWCVSKKGHISKLLPSGKFKPIYSSIQNLEEHQNYESLTFGESRLWVGSNFGTLMGQSLSDSTHVKFDINSPNETITSVSEGKNNIIWFSTSHGRVFRGDISTLLADDDGEFNLIIQRLRNIFVS